jgi:hypothetical protein
MSHLQNLSALTALHKPFFNFNFKCSVDQTVHTFLTKFAYGGHAKAVAIIVGRAVELKET